MLTSPRVLRLLERAHAAEGTLQDWEVANLREMRREVDGALALPVALITRFARATARAEAAWVQARQVRSVEPLLPALDDVVQLVRDKASLLGQALGLAPLDALADAFSPGVSTVDVEALLKAYMRRLPGLVRDALELQGDWCPLPLAGRFGAEPQRALVTDVLGAIGFPFDRGRVDECSHAFTEGVPGDVRIAYRRLPHEPFTALLDALHEAGHAMYDLGLPADWLDQPVGQARGMVLEESQSLLLEMVIGRSRPFARFLGPRLRRHLGADGPALEPENIYRTLIRVRRSPVRVDADELTYPLHVMHRHELETRLLSGTLAVRELRDAWNEASERRLGVTPADDLEGVLQDVHWAGGLFGYYPQYVVGAAIAAQLAEALRRAVPQLDEQVASGEFGGLMTWLREAVHRHGARLSAQDLIREATGRPISANASLRYLEAKYLEDAPASSAAA
jgi:carboxypeptidase Taq